MFVSIVYVLFHVSFMNMCCTTGHNIQKMEVCHVNETEFHTFPVTLFNLPSQYEWSCYHFYVCLHYMYVF